MRNIKLVMMYDGSRYSGWQRLGRGGKSPAIQWVLEECLSEYLKEAIRVIGSGRTDAGTHALGQVANFHCKSSLQPEEMRKGLNRILPEDIRVYGLEVVGEDFHSRYFARSKTYEYRLDQRETPSVFTRKYTCHCPNPLKLEAMKEASGYLLGTHDFKGFSTVRKDDSRSTLRTLESIEFLSVGRELRIRMKGDGFLYNMVRIIVGTFLEIGEGKKSPGEILTILKTGDRQLAGPTVSSQGLFLCEVRY